MKGVVEFFGGFVVRVFDLVDLGRDLKINIFNNFLDNVGVVGLGLFLVVLFGVGTVLGGFIGEIDRNFFV